MPPATPLAAEGDVAPQPPVPSLPGQMPDASQEDVTLTFGEALAFWDAMGPLPPIAEATVAPSVSPPLPADHLISINGASSSAPPQPQPPSDANNEMATTLETMPPAAEGALALPSPVPPPREQMTNDATGEHGGLSFSEAVAFWEAMGPLPLVPEAPSVSPSLPADCLISTEAGPSSSAPPQPHPPSPPQPDDDTEMEIAPLTMRREIPAPAAETAALVTPSPPTKEAITWSKPSPAIDEQHLALQSTPACLAPATPEQQSPRAAPETPAQLQPSPRAMTLTQGIFRRCVAFLAGAGGRSRAGMGIVLSLASAVALLISASTAASKGARRSGC